MSKLIDMAGLKFGRLTVTRRSENNTQDKAKWHCICECGNEVDVIGYHLRRGNTKSCGCLQKETLHKLHILSRKHFGCTYCGSDKHYAKGYCKNCYKKARIGTLE